MALFTPEKWPLWFICAAMILSAVIDWWKFKVPNWLTFPIILSGWAFGLMHNLDRHLIDGDGAGGIGAALLGTGLGFLLLLPIYAIGGMGAGDVKMTMGFGSWVGAFYGLENGCLLIIVYAFVTGVLVGGVLALIMMMLRGQYRQNVQHTQEIVGDLFRASSVGEVAGKAKQRRPRWHRIPYGVPLCIGFVGYLLWSFWAQSQTTAPTQEPPAAKTMYAVPISTIGKAV